MLNRHTIQPLLFVNKKKLKKLLKNQEEDPQVDEAGHGGHEALSSDVRFWVEIPSKIYVKSKELFELFYDYFIFLWQEKEGLGQAGWENL